MWNKFLSGFNEIPHAVLRGARISYNLISYDHTDIGSVGAPFANVFADNLSNRWGEMSINNISTQPPMILSITNGLADISLSIDDSTLSIVNGQLSVKSIVSLGSTGEVQFDAPLYITAPAQQGDPSIVRLAVDGHTTTINPSGQLQSSILQGIDPLSVDDTNLQISLKHDDTLEIDQNDGSLKVASGLLEGYGAISVSEDPLSWAPLNLGFNPSLAVIKLNTSGDFVTINDTLCIASQGSGNVPYFALESGLTSSPDIFYYNSTSGTLHVPSLTITDSQSILQNTSVPSKGYLSRYLTTSPNTPIQLSPEELDRRTLSLQTGAGLTQTGGMLSVNLTSTNAGILVDNEVGSLTLDLIGGNGILVEDNVVSLDIVPGEGLVTYGNAWSAPIVAGEGVMVIWVPELGYEISAMPLQMKNPSSENDPPETTPPAQQGTLTSSQGAPLGTGVSGSVITTGSFIPGVLPVIAPDFIGSTLAGAGAIFGIGSVLGGLGALGAIFGLPPMVTIWGSNPRHDKPLTDGSGNIIQPLQPQLDANGNVIPVGNNSVSIGIDADGNAYLFEDTPIGFDAVNWLNGQGLGAAIVPNLSMVGNAIAGLGQQLYGNQIQTNTTSISSLQTSVSTIQGKQATDESNIATNTTNIATIQGKQTTDESNIATNTTNIATIQGKQATDETNIATNTTNIATIQGKQATDESNIATNTTNIATIQGTISNIPAANFSGGQYTNLKSEIKAAGIVTVSFDDVNQWVTISNSTSPSFVQGTFSSTLNPTSSTSTTGAVSVTQGGIYVAQNVYASSAPSVGQHLTNKTYTDATFQKIITASSPLSLSGSNVLSIDLSQYLTASSAASTYQAKISASSPLVLSTSSALSINTGAITTVGTLTSLNVSGNITQTSGSSHIWTGSTSGTVTMQPPATVTSYTMTLPGSLPAASGSALVSSTAGVLSWSDLSQYQGKISVSSPLILNTSNALSINTGAITTVGTLTSLNVSGNITQTSGSSHIWTGSTSGTVTMQPPATITSYTMTLPGSLPAASGSALVSSTAGVLSWSDLSQYQGKISVSSPLVLNTSNALSINTGAITTVGTLTSLTVSGNITQTGGSSHVFTGSSGGTLTLQPVATISTFTLTLPGSLPAVSNSALISSSTGTMGYSPLGNLAGKNSINLASGSGDYSGVLPSANVDLSNTQPLNSNLTSLSSSTISTLSVTSTTASTSSTTGALKVTGGVGIGGSVFVGTNLNVSGTTTVASPVNASDAGRKDYIDGLSYLTAGTGLTKTGSSLSVNAIQSQITSVGTLTNAAIGGSSLTGDHTVAGGLFDIQNTTYQSTNLTTTSTNWYPITVFQPTLSRSGSTTGQINFSASLYIQGVPLNGTNQSAFNNSYGILVGGSPPSSGSVSSCSCYFQQGIASAHVMPYSTGAFDLGGTSYYWRNAYVQNITCSNNVTSAGNVNVTNTTASSSTTTGALTVSGGLGVSGSLYALNVFVGGNVAATQSWVTGQNYQPLLTAGTGVTISSNTISVNASQTQITSLGTLSSNLNLGGGTMIMYPASGTGPPAFTTRSSGTKIVYYPQESTTSVDYGVGMDAGTLWWSIPLNDSGHWFKWYGGTTNVMSLDGAGNLSVPGADAVVNLGGAPSGDSHRLLMTGTSGSSNFGFIAFYYGGTKVGNIITQGTSTAYNTTSDYRIKQNVVDLANACDRLSQIPVYRFNFVGHSQTVDGMFAHQVQTVVPESVTGHKDEVDENGEMVLQGIDQSKLVPLLIASVKELIERVSALEKTKK